ncbi:MAG: Holliday junction branch migration protein RuvA [Rhodobiaceae bacterium]|jgi:Holliday junction DNA helicase RuvA|nr:Holliday junction branch migration protein RuvA [Rhodobiaceae bacterium]MBT5640843.1 Holliday junction branch migration protein RuvA [Rhodobiaceae bacterium]MBT6222530.1 Holliday junction branch migration protein RuvA [Rhodobiaceae bacterium]MDB4832028.1 Holliday junction branch migration protein RuvA [Hyphomicrobiales bacterium]MDC3272280.1 Holliday junction branch migration protein RuvA [Hyphomicrobiales bacterium]|tara:strand:- start:2367 stop:2948 length:582 start_codon:yes stop_codon:yes gene_type:complete
MIGKLVGNVDQIFDETIILDISGVGYEVYCPERVIKLVENDRKNVTLYIETRIRDDVIKLYGFPSLNERICFRLLQTVQGVGAKVALTVLGLLSTEELERAISLNDDKLISRVPGIGPKVAKRIVVELQDKFILDKNIQSSSASIESDSALSALINLGYGRLEASRALTQIINRSEEELAIEELIKRSLKELS